MFTTRLLRRGFVVFVLRGSALPEKIGHGRRQRLPLSRTLSQVLLAIPRDERVEERADACRDALPRGSQFGHARLQRLDGVPVGADAVHLMGDVEVDQNRVVLRIGPLPLVLRLGGAPPALLLPPLGEMRKQLGLMLARPGQDVGRRRALAVRQVEAEPLVLNDILTVDIFFEAERGCRSLRLPSGRSFSDLASRLRV